MKSDDLNDKYQSEVQRQSTCQPRPIKKHSRSYRTTDLGGRGDNGSAPVDSSYDRDHSLL